jgi:hypothetical protein
MNSATGPSREAPDSDGYLAFESEEAFRAWGREQGPEAERFVENTLASDAELQAWRAAGKPGFPPGSISRTEYERQRALRSTV